MVRKLDEENENKKEKWREEEAAQRVYRAERTQERELLRNNTQSEGEELDLKRNTQRELEWESLKEGVPFGELQKWKNSET